MDKNINEYEVPEFLEGDVVADMSRDSLFAKNKVVLRFITFKNDKDKLGRLIPMSEDEYQALKKYFAECE